MKKRSDNKNKSLIKKIKTGGGLFSLATVCLFGVGFSDWLLVGNNFSNQIDFNVQIGDTLKLLKLNYSTGRYNICKYGFVGTDNQIVSTCLYSWNITLYQSYARESGYINDEGNANFYIRITDRTTNSFVNLFDKSIFSGSFYLTYNGTNTIESSLISNNGVITASNSLTGIDSSDTCELILNVSLKYNSELSDELETILNSYNYDKGLSFKASFGFEDLL